MIRPSDDEIAACNKADNACAYLAALLTTDMKDAGGELPQWIAQCNAHPVKNGCFAVVGYLMQSNAMPPGLTCGCSHPLTNPWCD